MPDSTSSSRVSLLAALLLVAASLAACSGNDTILVQPPPEENPAPIPSFTVLGNPRVAVRFSGFFDQASDSASLAGYFRVELYDSIGRRTFLPDVRINDVPMHQELDPFGSPSRYLLDPAELPGISLDDTLFFQVVDGGVISPPFVFRIVPSRMFLPRDTTTIHKSQDLVLPWTGAVERVLVNLIDESGRRLRVNLQFENYSGGTRVVIPGRDLAQLAEGDLQAATDVLDTEVRLSASAPRQDVTFESRQTRLWRLVP